MLPVIVTPEEWQVAELCRRWCSRKSVGKGAVVRVDPEAQPKGAEKMYHEYLIRPTKSGYLHGGEMETFDEMRSLAGELSRANPELRHIGFSNVLAAIL